MNASQKKEKVFEKFRGSLKDSKILNSRNYKMEKEGV